MTSVIKQLYNGNLCLNEQTATCFSGFCTTRDVVAQTHNAFEDKLCQPMKQELGDYLSKESGCNVLSHRTSLCRWLQGWCTAYAKDFGGGRARMIDLE